MMLNDYIELLVTVDEQCKKCCLWFEKEIGLNSCFFASECLFSNHCHFTELKIEKE